ncbi:hypothetical protein D3C85_1525620 [compost metagenome]
MYPTNGRYTFFNWCVAGTLIAGGACFSHPICDGHFAHVHVTLDSLHDLDRARCTRHDAGAQCRQIELLKAWMIEFCDEHRRNAMKCRAAFVLYCLKDRHRIK